MDKLPFDVGVAFTRIEDAARPWPKAALFQLAEEGYSAVFEQLLACIISIRTYDEVTLPVSRRLFARARTPAEVARLSWEALDALISPSTFHERKANQIRLLVPFRKHTCTGNRPHCSACPVLDMCRQVGVTEHR